MDSQTLKDKIKSLNFKNHADIRAAAALPEILNAIVDAVSGATLVVKTTVDTEAVSNVQVPEDLATAFGITGEQTFALLRGEYNTIIFENIGGYKYVMELVSSCTNGDLSTCGVFYGGWGGSEYSAICDLWYSEDGVSAEINIV